MNIPRYNIVRAVRFHKSNLCIFSLFSVLDARDLVCYMTTSRIGDDGVCTVWQDGDIATRFHRTSQGWRNTRVRDWRRARPLCSYLKDPARFCTEWLNFQKKFKQCTNISFGNLLVVQIYVVHLFSAVGVCTVCVWFFLPFVCLITLFVGAKTKRFTFRLHFVDLLKNIET